MNRRERRRAAKRGDIVEIKLGRVTIKPGDNTCFLCSKPATAWPRSQGMAYGGFVRINRRIALLCEQCFTTEEKQTPSQHRRRDQRARRQADKLTPPSASPEGRHTAAEESERDIITRLAGTIARKRLRSRRWRG